MKLCIAQVRIVRYQPLAYFGFMHLISSNLCLWLNTLIRELTEVLGSLSSEDSESNGHNESNHTGESLPIYWNSLSGAQQSGVVIYKDQQVLTVIFLVGLQSNETDLSLMLSLCISAETMYNRHR